MSENCLFLLECLYWHGKEKLRSQLNRLFWLGVVHLVDVVDNESQSCLNLKMPNDDYVFPKITDLFGRNYKIYHCCMDLFHWNQRLHLGWFGGYRMVNSFYRSVQIYCIILQWHHYLCYLLKQKGCGMYVSRMQGGCKYYNMVDIPIFHFVQRYSYWRVMIVGLPLGLSLKRRGLGSNTCFFYTILLEGNTCRFIKCPITCIIWKYLSDIWQVLTCCYLRPQ